MLKKSANGVLASFRPSTYPRGYASASKTLGAHQLAPVRKRDAHYSSRRGPRWALRVERRVLARPGGRVRTTAFLNALLTRCSIQSRYTENRLFIVGLWTLLVLTGLVLSPLYAQDYPPDRARGKAVYERYCQSCHGPSGRGNGPAAASLQVPPANFQRFQSFLKSDEELLRTIEHGIVFSPMHAWRGQLTDGEMQDVVAYIRLLSQQAR